ncbi:PREDICTED: uncharacterized protein LOC106103495 [Papilio polytes]|uniref:uncharacterized protein LOC106103495 n=1 Tax=Papilio polytes TaxID=76194 RepID=UPI0006765089|nr:PREDICTED: uncharacterized protein LOC106103495 [Papilio polytes]
MSHITMLLIHLMLIFCSLTNSHAAMIHLDGLLDIGKKWNYELQLTQVTEGKIKFALESKLSPPPLTTKSEIEYILPNMIRIGNVGKGVKTNAFIPNKEEAMKINISLQFENDEIGPVKKKKNNKSHLRQRAEILTPRKIKDDESIQRYILHLYNQALIVLENIQAPYEIQTQRSFQCKKSWKKNLIQNSFIFVSNMKYVELAELLAIY